MCSLKTIGMITVLGFFSCIGLSILANWQSFQEGLYAEITPAERAAFQEQWAELIFNLSRLNELCWPIGHIIVGLIVLYFVWGSRDTDATKKYRQEMQRDGRVWRWDESENNESPLGD